MSDGTRDGTEERFFEQIAAGDAPAASAPARLKSRIYSALMQREAQEGPLSSVSQSESEGRDLCVFEKAVAVTPAPDSIKSLNFCRVCHARVLAEYFENAPIYWGHCPYVAFQKPGKP
jgi:hypothetical protein